MSPASESRPAARASRKPHPKRRPPKPSRLAGCLRTALGLVLLSPAIYVALLAVLVTPWFQHQLVFLNHINVPVGANFSAPEGFGFPHGQVRAFRIPVAQTNGSVELGVWHVLSTVHHRRMMRVVDEDKSGVWSDDVYDEALSTLDTVVYLHGNAANRAARHRLETYKAIAADLGANVIAFDYRGFGDSSGWPSEQGLCDDAYAVWQHLISRGADPKRITLLGHSLGTAVATQLAARLSKEGTPPRALILKGGFVSIPDVIFDFSIFGVIQLLYPVRHSRYLKALAWDVIEHQFHTQKHVKAVTCPILILHGSDDEQIPAFHSKILFETVYLARRQPSWSIVESRAAHGKGKSLEHPDAQVQYVELVGGMHNDLHKIPGTWATVWAFLDKYARV